MTDLRFYRVPGRGHRNGVTLCFVPGATAKSLTHSADRLLEGLRDAYLHRRIADGFALVRSSRKLFLDLDSHHPAASFLVGQLARWVDAGLSELPLLLHLISRFPPSVRERTPLAGYLELRLAEGIAHMEQENPAKAIGHFESILAMHSEITDRSILAVALFAKSRCERRQGNYDDAVGDLLRGRELAVELGLERFSAVMQVLEGWLLFQRGKTWDATKSLEIAEAALRDTDDCIALGNIQSTYGRMLRREGRYEQSLARFEKSLEEYRKRDAAHPNAARSLANMAHVKRLLALQMRAQADTLSKKRRLGSEQEADATQTRERLRQLEDEAREHLDQALKIYQDHERHRGAGTVHVTSGNLFLDRGELDNAEREAAQAFQLGQDKADLILMARARLLQSMVENARYEEQIGDPGQHAQAAMEYARDAVDYAEHTQSRRLLARVTLWQGVVFSNDWFRDMQAARQCHDRSTSILNPSPHDPLWIDLQTLKSRLSHSGPIDATLRAWSQGLVGDKTFQQITDEFAELIIPKVWEAEGRKVSRVAARLSISPKKVRRILRNLGANAQD